MSGRSAGAPTTAAAGRPQIAQPDHRQRAASTPAAREQSPAPPPDRHPEPTGRPAAAPPAPPAARSSGWPGRRRARARSWPAMARPPRARHAAHTATSRKPAAGTSRVASDPWAMMSGEKAYIASATRPPTGPKRSRAKTQDDDAQQPASARSSAAGRTAAVARVVTGLVEQRAGPAPSGRRRNPGRAAGPRTPARPRSGSCPAADAPALYRRLCCCHCTTAAPAYTGSSIVGVCCTAVVTMATAICASRATATTASSNRRPVAPIRAIYARLGVRSSIPHGDPYAPASRSRNGSGVERLGTEHAGARPDPGGQQLQRDHRVDRGLPDHALGAVLAHRSGCRPRGRGTPRAAPVLPGAGDPEPGAGRAVHPVAEERRVGQAGRDHVARADHTGAAARRRPACRHRHRRGLVQPELVQRLAARR